MYNCIYTRRYISFELRAFKNVHLVICCPFFGCAGFLGQLLVSQVFTFCSFRISCTEGEVIINVKNVAVYFFFVLFIQCFFHSYVCSIAYNIGLTTTSTRMTYDNEFV